MGSAGSPSVVDHSPYKPSGRPVRLAKSCLWTCITSFWNVTVAAPSLLKVIEMVPAGATLGELGGHPKHCPPLTRLAGATKLRSDCIAPPATHQVGLPAESYANAATNRRLSWISMLNPRTDWFGFQYQPDSGSIARAD